MDQEKAVLHIHALRGGIVDEIVSFLTDLQNAYENLYALNLRIDEVKEKTKGDDYFYAPRTRTPSLSPVRRVRDVVLPAERLFVFKIAIESPGFWEFVGSLNPLQQLREYLKD